MPKKANLTVAEIKSALTKEGISYPAWAKRPAFVKIYAQNFIQAGSKTDDDTIISSYNTAKRIRMEQTDQRNAERQAVKETRKSQTSSSSEIQPMTADSTDATSLNLDISYLEASQRVSCTLYNHLAWLITDASPEVGEDGRVYVSQKQHEQILNLA